MKKKKPGRKKTDNTNRLNILLSNEIVKKMKAKFPEIPLVVVIRLALQAFVK